MSQPRDYGMAQRFKVGAGLKLNKGAAGGGADGFRIQDRVGVQAPAEVVWELIYDLHSWSEWNSLYTSAEGQIRIGSTLSLTQTLPGRPPRTLHARVLEWVPHEQLHWRVAQLGGLAVSTGYIEIEALAPSSCIVSTGELVKGFLAPFVVHPRALRRGLRQMNEGLKAAAESRWTRDHLTPGDRAPN